MTATNPTAARHRIWQILKQLGLGITGILLFTIALGVMKSGARALAP